MKKSISAILILILFFTAQSCFYNNGPDRFPDNYKPVIMERAAFENSIALLPPRNVIKAGKIYIKDNYAFVNDENEGFHIYNYSNPATPIAINFLKIPGATDVSIRNNILYINQAVDLVTLNYNPNSNNYSFKHRNKNVFPQKLSPEGSIAQTNENQIVVKWISN